MSNFEKIVVQDDLREKRLAEIFELSRPGGRIFVDAVDENGNQYELKTTSKGSVSTARDLGYKHLDKWKNQYWIVAEFSNKNEAFDFERFWFLSPFHMRGWYNHIRQKLDYDHQIANEAISILKANNAEREVVQRIEKLCADGALLNDPNINKGYIQKYGIRIFSNHAVRLRELVKEYPLNYTSISDEFFSFEPNHV